MAQPPSPTYPEIMDQAQALAAAAPARVSYRELGRSEEGRPIPLLTLGDAARDLPLLLVTGGTHGSEETGRAGSMALAEWLAGDGAGNLDHLSVLLVPCLNPDGAEANSYHNARDINLCTAFPYNARAITAEARALEDLALDLLPDCIVDVHGLAGGAMGDSGFTHPTLDSVGQDISHRVVAELNATALALGFPQRHPYIENEFKMARGSLCRKLAALTGIFCFTMETTENYYPLADSVRSTLVRLQKLVEIGQRVHFNQPYPNFPSDNLLGGHGATFLPFGGTYRRRRESRLKAMSTLIEVGSYFERSHADPGKIATLTFRLDAPWQTAPEGLAFGLALDPRATVKKVTYLWPDGEVGELSPATLVDEHGYYQWQEGAIQMLRASVARPPAQGQHQVKVEYTAPWEPHVAPTWREYSYERRR